MINTTRKFSPSLMALAASLCAGTLLHCSPAVTDTAAPATPATTEQVEPEKPFEKRLAKAITRIALAVPDLSEEQNTKMQAIGDGIKAELDTIRDNMALSTEEKQKQRDAIHENLPARLEVVLAPAQLVKWKEAVEARRQRQVALDNNLRDGETLEQKHARVLKPYTDVITDLTADQKAKLLPIVEAASDVLDEVRADASRTPEQKAKIEGKIQAKLLADVSQVLTEKQLATWKKATEKPAKTKSNKQ